MPYTSANNPAVKRHRRSHLQWGALDFAGGTVVHINAGVPPCGCVVLGKRIGLARSRCTPRLTMTMIGASLLCRLVWLIRLGARGERLRALAFMNTYLATAARCCRGQAAMDREG